MDKESCADGLLLLLLPVSSSLTESLVVAAVMGELLLSIIFSATLGLLAQLLFGLDSSPMTSNLQANHFVSFHTSIGLVFQIRLDRHASPLPVGQLKKKIKLICFCRDLPFF